MKLKKRLGNLRKVMKSLDLDAMIINDKANRYYISGFTGTYGQVVISNEGQYIVADGRYFEQLKTQSPDFEIIDNKMLMNETISKFIELKGFRSIGFESEAMNVEEYLSLKKINYDTNLIPTVDLIERLRMIKDQGERDKIAKAGEIADKTFEYILSFIKPGMTEKQVANEIDRYGLELGADAPAFETIVASGIRSSLPHGHASNKVIEKNELIILDFGFEKEKYFSDITRTVCLGRAKPELKKIYNIVLDAQKKAIESCQESIKLAFVDSIARDYIAQEGYGDQFLHGTGHGIGLTVHEYPLLNSNSIEIIQPKMTFTVEPGIYLENQGGVRIEDDVWIDEKGNPEALTKSDKDWIEL